MTRILDGKSVASEIRSEVAQRVREMTAEGGRPPGLAAVLVGEDPASKIYVGSKARACEEVGIRSQTLTLPAEVTEEETLSTVAGLNGDPEVDGILVQLPLPDHMSERRVLDAVDPQKDVDGFHPLNVGRLWLGEEAFVPATPAGILELLRRAEIPLEGRQAVVVGRSAIVGKPVSALLLHSHCTVTVCHSRTRDLPGVCRQADILVAAVGRPAMIDADFVKEGAVVIDVGINRLQQRQEVERIFRGDEERLEKFERRGSVLVGDVHFAQVAPKAAAITPVPGGVGPLTVAMLLVNTLKAARRRSSS
jgi:methylenetetrahydrofolate dehydrogenase (NADP+)/methenyltetrahydrofolate cyclohydrolase